MGLYRLMATAHGSIALTGAGTCCFQSGEPSSTMKFVLRFCHKRKGRERSEHLQILQFFQLSMVWGSSTQPQQVSSSCPHTRDSHEWTLFTTRPQRDVYLLALYLAFLFFLLPRAGAALLVSAYHSDTCKQICLEK